ncbi:MAG: glutamate 5-kinase, partial [Woeseiaceae bacterium]|nr:glutamate 5-kinase [Woeseiaceae bacterium]
MTGLTAQDYRRLVIKVGSSLLIDENGNLDAPWLSALAADIAERHSQGQQILVVSSGAIAIGSGVLGINVRRSRLEDLQAAAAAGQVALAHAYSEALGRHGIKTAQVLLTPDDTENRRRFLNARGTLQRLLDHDV